MVGSRRREEKKSSLIPIRDHEMRERQGQRFAGTTTASSTRTVGAFRKFTTTTCVRHVPLGRFVPSRLFRSFKEVKEKTVFPLVIRDMVGDSDLRSALMRRD
jgi:hypothetical protein